MSEKTYYAAHLQSITDYYRDCNTAMVTVRDEIVNLRTCVDEYYNGLATGTLLDELFLTIDRHVEVLADCFGIAADYVDYTNEETISTDNRLSHRRGLGM